MNCPEYMHYLEFYPHRPDFKCHGELIARTIKKITLPLSRNNSLHFVFVCSPECFGLCSTNNHQQCH